MAKRALGCEYNQRLAPCAQRLPPQKVKVLRGVRGLGNLEIVHRCKLQEAFDARAGVLRSLAFVAVRQQEDQARKQVPLGFSGNNELIDDRLRDVSKVAELCLPENQRFRIVAAVAVFEAEDACFGES